MQDILLDQPPMVFLEQYSQQPITALLCSVLIYERLLSIQSSDVSGVSVWERFTEGQLSQSITTQPSDDSYMYPYVTLTCL